MSPCGKARPLHVSFPGSASAGQASRKGPNAGCDAAHHLSSSVRSASPSRPSCPLPVNVFFFLTLKFAFKIFVFLWESHISQINLPRNVRITVSLFAVASFVAGMFHFKERCQTQPACPCLPVAASRQTRWQHQKSGSLTIATSTRWEPGHFPKTRDGHTLFRWQTPPSVHTAGTQCPVRSLHCVTMVCECVVGIFVSVFVSQYFKLNLKKKMFLNRIY